MCIYRNECNKITHDYSLFKGKIGLNTSNYNLGARNTPQTLASSQDITNYWTWCSVHH